MTNILKQNIARRPRTYFWMILTNAFTPKRDNCPKTLSSENN